VNTLRILTNVVDAGLGGFGLLEGSPVRAARKFERGEL
jgi:hypothetical protein